MPNRRKQTSPQALFPQRWESTSIYSLRPEYPGSAKKIHLTCLQWLAFLLIYGFTVSALATEPDANTIMAKVHGQQEQYPYVYEEQSMILIDKSGNRDVRNTRRYIRIDASGKVNVLLVFDSPEEVKGVALLASQRNEGPVEAGIYLPAFENRMISSDGESSSERFLGSDFSVFDLKPARHDEYRYRRLEDVVIGEDSYYRIAAIPVDQKILKQSGYSKRIHTISKDNLLIIKTGFYDRHGQHIKTLTQHEFKRYGNGFWQPDMILMDNLAEQHKTLIKTRERVFSPDYVPPKMFTRQWLFNHNHMASTVQHIFDNTLTPEKPEQNNNNDH